MGHRDSWHPLDTRPLSGNRNPGGEQGPARKKRGVGGGRDTGAGDRTGNSKARFSLEKMQRTHNCSGREKRIQSMSGLERKPPTPGTPENGLST